MVHWLFCQSCKQWSKSANPLSNDMLCPLCSNPFISEKTYTNFTLDNKTEVRPPKTPKNTQTPEASEIAPMQDSAESMETLPTPDALETLETSEESEMLEKLDEAEVSETVDKPDALVIPEKPDEIAKPDTPEISEAPEGIEVTEEIEVPEPPQEPKTIDKETQKIKETTENNASNEVMGTIKKEKPAKTEKRDISLKIGRR